MTSPDHEAEAYLRRMDARMACEEALRAFPLWPFNRWPFVRIGSWWLLRKAER